MPVGPYGFLGRLDFKASKNGPVDKIAMSELRMQVVKVSSHNSSKGVVES